MCFRMSNRNRAGPARLVMTDSFVGKTTLLCPGTTMFGFLSLIDRWREQVVGHVGLQGLRVYVGRSARRPVFRALAYNLLH